MSKQGFTAPRLYNYKGDMKKEWYVGFRHTCPQSGVRKGFQIRAGINYATTASQRTTEGNALAKLLNTALQEGWNPHHEDLKSFLLRDQAPEKAIEQMPVVQALDFAFSKKRLAKKSNSCIGGVKDFAKEAAFALGIAQLPICEFRRKHAKALLEQIEKDRNKFYATTDNKRFRGLKFTGNTYNKYKGYFQMLFSELVEYEAIDFNPFDRLKGRPAIKTNPHRHATVKEVEKIKKHLKENQPYFFIYLLAEYHTGIRPKELFSLQVKDFDRLNQCFHVRPIEDGSKTRIARMVPIPNAFMQYLFTLQLDKYPPDYYIFSTYFQPGAIRKKRDYATKLWYKAVKEELRINVSLYSFKGLGGEDKRAAGIDAVAVQKQFGHTKMSTTMIYLHREQDRINQMIKEHSPDL